MTGSDSQLQLTDTRRNVRTLAFGLVWGFVVLTIFSLWGGQKEGFPGAITPLTWLAALASLGLGIWLFVRNRRADESKLKQQEKLVSTLLLGAGAMLVALGIWIGVSQKLPALGEAIGLVVLGLIALGVGLRIRAGASESKHQDSIMQRLVAARKSLALGKLIAGGVLVAVAIWLRFKVEAAFPEWGGVLSFGFIAIGAGIWLLLSTNVNANSIRMLILIVGGLTGLVIFLMAAGRAWLWRDDLFFRGIAEWRGPGGWRIWLCAYMGLFGLALMFGSFYLARTDIRANPVLRRVLYGYNALFTGLLLLAFLVVLNIVVYAAYPQTFEWSQTRGLYTLSESSKHTLQELKQPTTIYVVMSRRTRIFKDLQLLLDNCQAESGKLNVEYIFPDKDFVRYDTLSTRYPEVGAKTAASEDLGRGVLLVYGVEPDNPKQKPPPHAFVPASKLFKVDRGGPRGGGGTYTFVGEQVLLSELKFLMGGEKKSKIYFLQGNGELALKDARVLFRGLRVERALDEVGMEVLIDLLKKENYEVRGLNFGRGKDDALMHYVPEDKEQRKEVPKDADIVVIAGASNRIPKETLDALQRYMDRDGKLVVLADLRTDTDSTEIKTTGLEEFLKKYNVDLTNDFVMRFPADRDDIPVLAYAITAAKSENLIAKKFADQLFRLFTVRVVKPGSGGGPSFKAEPLLEVRGLASETFEQSLFWAENQASALPNPIRYALDLQKSKKLLDKVNQEVIPVAVTVSDNHPNDRPRLVVFGDAEWASDAFLGQQLRGFGRGGKQYFNLLVSSFDWLSKRPGVGGRPKEPSVYSLNPTASGPRMVLLPLWLMVVVVFALGLGTWLVRRK